MEAQDFLEKIKETFPCPEQDVRAYSPLALAFVGDGVFSLVVRTMIVNAANRANHALHNASVKYVKAENQSKIVDVITPILTQEESDILRRGCNAKPHTTAKNASLKDYHKATGLEALVGYLYLAGRTDRMLELLKIGFDSLTQADGGEK